MKIFIIILFSLSSNEFHDFKIGRFELRPEKESITLYVRLDRYNLLEAIKTNCTDYNELAQCFENYLNSHFVLSFDGDKVVPKHSRHEFGEEFIELFFDLDTSPDGVEKIEVFNDTLLELYESQENILYSLLNNKNRSFRMNKGRIRTIIQY